MLRRIVDFALDDEGDWTAILDCGHPQHVRHNPPFINRPWTKTRKGRQSKLGERLDCLRCDRLEIPDSCRPAGRTPTYSDATAPLKLLEKKAGPTGVWTRITVLAGYLHLQTECLSDPQALSPAKPGIVAPGMHYRLAPLAGARFFLTFYATPVADWQPS